MENARAKDALVVGDDSVVFKDFTEGTSGTCDSCANPPQELYDDYWDFVYEELGVLVKERNEKHNRSLGSVSGWFVEGSGMGWRGQRGHKFIDVQTYERKNRAVGFDFLNQILPQTDNTFYIYDMENGNGLLIHNRNHDAPVNPERYECLPLDYMIDEGLWWGINSSEGDIIEAIWEQVMYEWEQFLNEYCAATNDKGEKIGGRAEVLDIEGMSLVTEFLARYKLKPGPGTELLVVRDDLLGFFDRHYSTPIIETWTAFLQENSLTQFGDDLFFFLDDFGLNGQELPKGETQRLETIWEKIYVDKQNR